MKLKSKLVVAVFGASVLFGLSGTANAQTSIWEVNIGDGYDLIQLEVTESFFLLQISDSVCDHDGQGLLLGPLATWVDNTGATFLGLKLGFGQSWSMRGFVFNYDSQPFLGFSASGL